MHTITLTRDGELVRTWRVRSEQAALKRIQSVLYWWDGPEHQGGAELDWTWDVPGHTMHLTSLVG
jgi:hypothetical protein